MFTKPHCGITTTGICNFRDGVSYIKGGGLLRALPPSQQQFIVIVLSRALSNHISYMIMYGRFPKLGHPNVDPNILYSLHYRDPQKSTPNFGKPPYGHFSTFTPSTTPNLTISVHPRGP